MNANEFAVKVKEIADKSDLDNEIKKDYALFIAAACDSDEHKNLIEAYMQKDGVTLNSLFEYVISIMPPVEIVDDEE